MKRPVTEQDLIADPSLASIGVKLGDEYEFADASPAEEPRIAKFDPYTGAPLEAPAEQAAPAETTQVSDAPTDAEQASEVKEPEAEAAPSDEPASDNDESAGPITYAEIIERGISLNKVEAANLHPGISQIAQWGDLVIEELFKPEK